LQALALPAEHSVAKLLSEADTQAGRSESAQTAAIKIRRMRTSPYRKTNALSTLAGFRSGARAIHQPGQKTFG
jgi:LAS superfamily LD-carboxypeptidase LdcB